MARSAYHTNLNSTYLNFPNLNSINLNPASLNSIHLNSSNLDSTNLNVLTISLHSTSDSRLRCLDTQLFVGLLWHTATTTRRPSSLSSLSCRKDTNLSSRSAILPFHSQLFTEISNQLHSVFITVVPCLHPQNAALRLRFPDNLTHNPLAPTNFFSKRRSL